MMKYMGGGNEPKWNHYSRVDALKKPKRNHMLWVDVLKEPKPREREGYDVFDGGNHDIVTGIRIFNSLCEQKRVVNNWTDGI